MWRSLCECVGRLDLRDDVSLATGEGRFQQRARIWEALEAAFKTRTADDWVGLLRAEDVPVGVVNTLDRALTDPHVVARDMVLDIEGPGGVHLKVAGNPLKMSDGSVAAHRFPPKLGQDTREVLAAELGLAADEIDALTEAGVVKASR